MRDYVAMKHRTNENAGQKNFNVFILYSEQNNLRMR